MDNKCLFCRKDLIGKTKYYCSNKCQADYSYVKYIKDWKAGLNKGTRGLSSFNLSAHIIRYIKLKYKNSCAKCGWNEINTYSLRSPLEIDHIDGDSTNNKEENLILLCPNCHSLTKTYKNLNLGHGRVWRRQKYVKIVDVPL